MNLVRFKNNIEEFGLMVVMRLFLQAQKIVFYPIEIVLFSGGKTLIN